MASAERSLAETFKEFGLNLEGGITLPSSSSRGDRSPEINKLHQDLANQFLSGQAEASFRLDPTGIKFLIDQGIGSQFLLRVDPKSGRLRPDDKTIDVFATVDPDTNTEAEELRIAMNAGVGLTTPPNFDPHRIEKGLNPDNINRSLGSMATLDRGEHIPGSRISTTQAGHVLSVVASNLPDTTAGAQIASLDLSAQPHFPDAKQQRGGEGLLVSLSTNALGENLFDEPLTRWPILSARNPLPAGIGNFQVIIPEYLLVKAVPEENSWAGEVDISYLLAGKIRLVRAINPKTVEEKQELAFAKVIRKGSSAVSRFTASVERSAAQKGW